MEKLKRYEVKGKNKKGEIARLVCYAVDSNGACKKAIKTMKMTGEATVQEIE